MANKSDTVTIRGKASYAKIIGDPVPNYNKDGKEWKMDLQISEETAKELKQYGITDRVKRKDDYLDGAPYLSFKQAEFTKAGKANEPIKIFDIAGKPWDDRLIGNGSDVDVQFAVVDYGKGMKKGVYIRKVRVLKLVPYEKQGFDPIDENDEFYAEAAAIAAERAGRESVPFDTGDELDDDISDIAL